MRDQSNKNKYFFAMSPFKVVYLCTFLSVFVFNKRVHSVETPDFFPLNSIKV